MDKEPNEIDVLMCWIRTRSSELEQEAIRYVQRVFKDEDLAQDFFVDLLRFVSTHETGHFAMKWTKFKNYRKQKNRWQFEQCVDLMEEVRCEESARLFGLSLSAIKSRRSRLPKKIIKGLMRAEEIRQSQRRSAKSD